MSLSTKGCNKVVLFTPPPEHVEVLANSKIIVFECSTISSSMIATIRVLHDRIEDKVWKALMSSISKFFKWVEEHHMKYHFLIDIHKCSSIPMKELYELQGYLSKKKRVLQTWLHSSAVITQSNILEMVLTTAFQFFPPSRPLKIFLQPLVPDAECDPTTKIPTNVLKEAMTFLQKHRLEETERAG